MSNESAKALVEAESLITHLQTEAETGKVALARELHDELGGLMVSAVMDLASVQQLQPALAGPAIERLERVKKTLESAIDLKRRVIEELRPSILDNFGLFAALRWHLKRLCEESKFECVEHYPEVEPHLEPEASIGLFRIAQEALAMTLKRGSVRSTSLHVHVADGTLSMVVSDDGTLESAGEEAASASTAMALIRHRIRNLGGRVSVQHSESGGTILTASLPLTPVPDGASAVSASAAA